MSAARLHELAARWRQDLAAWAIPDEILAQAAESPWHYPAGVFARRADDQMASPSGPSYEHALEALPAGGGVLDVGSGAGAASLPLGYRAGRLVAVDPEQAMLDAYAERAARVGVDVELVRGRWPDVAGQVARVDVVVCHHVLYNVADPVPFLRSMDSAARHRVVVELTARHPMTPRSEEHTSELQSRRDLVCRLLLEKKKKIELSLSFLKQKIIDYTNRS